MKVNNFININKTQNIKKDCHGNQGPGLGQAQKYGGVKPANDLSTQLNYAVTVVFYKF